jgi:uracil-DNA glycosylase
MSTPAARRFPDLEAVSEAVVDCRACPRLVAWREQVAGTKRAAYADQTYWGRPVPGFGDPGARVVIVGLAPAAHGANRTGRMFTGDRSGRLALRVAAPHRVREPAARRRRDDGLRLTGVWVTAPVRAPRRRTGRRPTSATAAPRTSPPSSSCSVAGRRRARRVRWDAVLRQTGLGGRKPRFGHGTEVELPTVARSSAATTSASRTPSPAGSPRRCSTRVPPRSRDRDGSGQLGRPSASILIGPSTFHRGP